MPSDDQLDLETFKRLLYTYQISLSARDKYRERESARDNPLKKSESEPRFHLRDVKDINEALDAMPNGEPGLPYQTSLEKNKGFFSAKGEGQTSKIGDINPQVENQAVQNLKELIILAGEELKEKMKLQVQEKPQARQGYSDIESEFKELITGIYKRIQPREPHSEKTKQLKELMNDYFPFIEFNENGTLKDENIALNNLFEISQTIPLLEA